ncbi:MAG: RICIN domain-containing protein [Planctomycetota bacterium]
MKLKTLALLAVALGVSAPSTAQYKTYFKLVAARNPNLVMEVRAASLSAQATIQSGIDNGGPHQQFEFPAATSGSFIVNRRSGMVIDIANGSSSTFARIQQYPRHGGTNQRWYVIGVGSGLVKIVSVHNNLCLGLYENGSSVPIRQTPYTGNIGDKWRLVIVRSVVDNKLTVRHTGKALEVRDGAMQANVGTPLQQATYTGHPKQVWFTEFLGGRRYSLVSRCTDQAIDVPGGSATATLNAFPTHHGPNQQFDMLPDSTWTYYQFRSARTNRVFGVEWGAVNDGARIAQFVASTTAWFTQWRVQFAN